MEYFRNRYAHMVQEHHVTRVRSTLEERAQRIAQLKTKKDAQNYVKQVRQAIRKCFAPFPKRTALNARVTGTTSKGHVTVEKIVYESRPNFYVTANLFRPTHINGKHPCALGVCGHSENGKAHANYQGYAYALASKGFIVLIIDPIAQGERKQFFKKDGGAFDNCCNAHNQMGNQMMLIDEFFGTWRVWDGIRGLDYLLSRPDTDKTRVGVTGNSGGGTLTSYISAIEDRITMSAASCYICSIDANVANEEPTDSEQSPPGFLAAGLDHVDLLIAAAPRPTLILGQRHDFFSSRHTEKAAKDLKHIHKLLGTPKTARHFIGDGFHGFQDDARQEMVSWFMKHAKLKGSTRIPKLEPLPDEELYATKKGIIDFKNHVRVFEITKDNADTIAKTRKKLSADNLARKAKQLLQLNKIPAGMPEYRALTQINAHTPYKLRAEVFCIETEPGIQAIVEVYNNGPRKMYPPAGSSNVYVGHISSGDDVLNNTYAKDLLKTNKPLITIDPRGIGQSCSKSCGDIEFFHPYGADYMYASIGEMYKNSYLGQRVFDVLRSLDWLYANGSKNITLHGRGINSITVAFAALIHKNKPKVKLHNYLTSYQSLCDSPQFTWPCSSLLRGVLKHFDLPDVYKALGKRLELSQPWNQFMKNKK